MENIEENIIEIEEEIEQIDEPITKKRTANYLVPASILAGSIIIAASVLYVWTPRAEENAQNTVLISPEEVIPQKGVRLPIKWNDLGAQMVGAGVIDKEKFENIYANRGGLSAQGKSLLENHGGPVVINNENSGELLNLLWAFGLANQNPVLEKGPISDPRFGGVDRFASTGGWTLSRGGPLAHFGSHQFVKLTADEQAAVERVAKNIYRPCCGNSTYFPDCNHGMAMLGLLELMAANGVSEKNMYKTALAVNSYWFPDTYLTLAEYFKAKNIKWSEVDPKTVLGMDYSGAQGFQAIKAQVLPAERKSSGGCGV